MIATVINMTTQQPSEGGNDRDRQTETDRDKQIETETEKD